MKIIEKKSEYRELLFEIIFKADTPAGKLFDIFLIFSILISVAIVMLDSVKTIDIKYGDLLNFLEWFFTIVFTIEYFLRLSCVRNPLKYCFSFFGIVDFLSIIPTYIGILLPGTHYLTVIRVLRVLRVFRILKLTHYIGESKFLIDSLHASARKITVFLFTVTILVIILGSLMYIIEGHENGFTSIPRSVYWAIVTLTTVGYGDISPQTGAGQTFAAFIMITGYAIIAVPTGIITAEITTQNLKAKAKLTTVCMSCSEEGHENDARYCKFCGSRLL